MKTTTLIFLALFSLLLSASAQTQNSKHHTFSEPLWLTINGPGRVLRLHNGQLLEVGDQYQMIAVPNPGHTFLGWTKVEVIITTDYLFGGLPVVTDILPLSGPDRTPILNFRMQSVIFSDGLTTTTETIGWVATFSTSSHLF